jgi:hypothetical protein
MASPVPTEKPFPWIETAPAVLEWSGSLKELLDEPDTEAFLHTILSQPSKDKIFKDNDIIVISMLRPELPKGQHLQDLELDDNDITVDTTLPEGPSPGTGDGPRAILCAVKEVWRHEFNIGLAPLLTSDSAPKRAFIIFRGILSLKLQEKELHMDDLAMIKIIRWPQWTAGD